MGLRCLSFTSLAVLVSVALLCASFLVLEASAYEHNLHPHEDPDPSLHQEEEPENGHEIHGDGHPHLDAETDNQCVVCQEVLVPALHKAIVASSASDHTLNLVRSVLQPLPYQYTFNTETKQTTKKNTSQQNKMRIAAEENDDEDYSSTEAADPYIQEAVEHLLWDSEMSRQVSALVRVYHDMHDRQDLIDKLIEHQICACDEDNLQIQDGKFNKLLMHHSATVERELATHPVVHEGDFAEQEASLAQGIKDDKALKNRNVEVMETSAVDEI